MQIPQPLPQCRPAHTGSLSESNAAPSTSSEQILSLQKAKNLDDHVPSLKRKRKGNVWILTNTPFCFKLNHKKDQEARNGNGRESKESPKTDVKVRRDIVKH